MAAFHRLERLRLTQGAGYSQTATAVGICTAEFHREEQLPGGRGSTILDALAKSLIASRCSRRYKTGAGELFCDHHPRSLRLRQVVGPCEEPSDAGHAGTQEEPVRAFLETTRPEGEAVMF